MMAETRLGYEYRSRSQIGDGLDTLNRELGQRCNVLHYTHLEDEQGMVLDCGSRTGTKKNEIAGLRKIFWR